MDHVVMVLGIARSGTSAVSGALRAAGVDFGTELKPFDIQSPKGNVEDSVLSSLNESVLSACGRRWSSIRPMPSGWLDRPQVKKHRAKIRNELETRFCRRGLVGIKDPRLVPLFPLYQSVLNELGLDYTLVATSRHRLEILQSIRKSGYFQGPFEIVLGRFLIQHYENMLQKIATENPVHWVEHRQLIGATESTIKSLIEAVPFRQSDITPFVSGAIAHIDPALHRNRVAQQSA